MKKILLLCLTVLLTVVFALNASNLSKPIRPKKTTTTEVSETNSAPYIHDINYADDYIVVEIRCDHKCRVAVSPKSQIQDLIVEAKRYTDVSAACYYPSDGKCFHGSVKFSCATGKNAQCKQYDFVVTEVGN